jgi:hypothetical protein
MNLIGPVYSGNSRPESPNDIMLSEVDHPEVTLYTRRDFCAPVDGPAVEVTVPAGTKQLIINVE